MSSLMCRVSLDGHECKLKPDWFAEAKKRDALILVSFDFSVWWLISKASYLTF